MGKGASEPGRAPPPSAPDGEATRTFLGDDPVGPPRQDDAASPLPHPPTEVAPPHPPPEIVRYGPGVPATPPAGGPGLTAEHAWRASRPAKPAGRTARLRWLLGPTLTVILLAVAGVTLYLRFHHAPFRVTGVEISQQTRVGCGVDVTGQITTNGSGGTVSYQWLFRPDVQAPQPLSQSVITGQHAVYVTAAVEGAGQGSGRETVTLQVLGPELATTSTAVMFSCR